jgi:hypothetical protein
MFLPFHDDNPTRRTAVVTYGLVAANVVAFLWLLSINPGQREDVTLHRGYIPARIEQLSKPKPVIITRAVRVYNPQFGVKTLRQEIPLEPNHGEIILSLFTCMFLHGGWVHLLGNMWFLWLFGNNVEDRLGHVAFLVFYLAGGLLGSAAHWLIDPQSLVPVIGASGAVAAVLGAYAITWPWARIHTLVFLVIFITVIDLPALGVLGAWFVLQLIQGQAQLGLKGVGGVASWAHVGGFVAGMVLMPLLGRLLGLGRPSTRQREARLEDGRDRIIDVQILDDDRRRTPRR